MGFLKLSINESFSKLVLKSEKIKGSIEDNEKFKFSFKMAFMPPGIDV